MLALQHITKRFGNVLALDDAELTVRSGTVHALLGENGAGKTTLLRIAYGMLRPDAGTIVVDGLPRKFGSSVDAIRAGIGMVHQHYALVSAMTVAENFALGGRGPYDASASAKRVRSIADATGLALDPQARVEDLSVEAQQRVEIVKALARDAQVLILDEPTAVLAPSTAADLLTWLRQFADEGHAVVLITHKLQEALRIADDITVLRHGRTVLTCKKDSTSESELAAAMLGSDRSTPDRPIPDRSIPDRPTPDRPIPALISATDVSVADATGTTRIQHATFAIARGEIVGVAAIEGQGQRELLRAIAGRYPVASGQLVTPDDVGFIPEDRHRDGLILDFSLYENLALRGAGSRHGRMPWDSIRSWTHRALREYDVRAPNEATTVATLSGGNQQKLVLARELGGEEPGAAPAALVAENPTRGLDIQASAAVHARLRESRARGMAIVIYASDVDEVLALADRVLVIARGTVREVVGGRDVVGRAMLGLDESLRISTLSGGTGQSGPTP